MKYSVRYSRAAEEFLEGQSKVVRMRIIDAVENMHGDIKGFGGPFLSTLKLTISGFRILIEHNAYYAAGEKIVYVVIAIKGENYMSPFFQQVYAVVAQIPKGKVMAYGQIAHELGRPRAAREVGWAMKHCPEHLPWQRVVKADGAVTGGQYSDLRRQLLVEEGVTFLDDGRVDMKAHQL